MILEMWSFWWLRWVGQNNSKKWSFKELCAVRGTQQRRRRERAAPHHQLYHGSSPYHSAPVPVIMRREWKHPLIRAVWCAIHQLITGSKTERPVSSLLSNFHTEALSRAVVSFVTSALASRSQSKLVREFHCFFLPPLMTSLKELGLFIKKTSLNSLGSCSIDADETEEYTKDLGTTLTSHLTIEERRITMYGWKNAPI